MLLLFLIMSEKKEKKKEINTISSSIKKTIVIICKKKYSFSCLHLINNETYVLQMLIKVKEIVKHVHISTKLFHDSLNLIITIILSLSFAHHISKEYIVCFLNSIVLIFIYYSLKDNLSIDAKSLDFSILYYSSIFFVTGEYFMLFIAFTFIKFKVTYYWYWFTT